MKKLLITLIAACMVVGCEENTYLGEKTIDGHLYIVQEGRTWNNNDYRREEHSERCPNPIHKDTCKCK